MRGRGGSTAERADSLIQPSLIRRFQGFGSFSAFLLGDGCSASIAILAPKVVGFLNYWWLKQYFDIPGVHFLHVFRFQTVVCRPLSNGWLSLQPSIAS